MVARIRPRIVAVALALAASTAGAPAQQAVGALGDLVEAEIHGLHQVTAAQLRGALLADPVLQAAATPSALLLGLTDTTRHQLLLALQRSGFRDAKVDVSVASQHYRLVIRVEEGERLLAGGVRIVGARAVDARLLQAHLLRSEPLPPLWTVQGGIAIERASPVGVPRRSFWEEGKPAPFDVRAMEWLRRDLRKALAWQGYFGASARVEIKVEDGRAVLEVRLEDEGPRAVLDKIVVEGAQRNQAADVVAHLGLEEGRPATGELLAATHDKLWRSARFWSHPVSLFTDADPARATLKIELREYAAAPPLAQPLGATAEVLLRCRDWLEKHVTADWDLVLEITAGACRLRAILSAQEGAIVRVDDAPVAPAGREGSASECWRRARAAFVLTPRTSSLHAVASHERFACEATVPRTVELSLEVLPPRDPGEPSPQSAFLYGAGLSSRPPDPGRTPVRMSMLLVPVCFLHALEDAAKTTLADGMLTLQAGGMTCRLDNDSGRPIDLVRSDAGCAMRLTIEQGAFRREMHSIQEAAPSAKDEPCSPGGLVAAVVAHGLAAQAADAAAQGTAARAMRRLLGPAMDRLVVGLASRLSSHELYVPLDPAVAQRESYLAQLLPVVDCLWERGSWPWTLSREMLLVALTQYDDRTHGESKRIALSPSTGPLGCLAIAHVSDSVGWDDLARYFAKLGLERLDAESFVRDCRALGGGESVLGECLSQVIQSLPELSDDELDALAQVLGAQGAAILRTLAREKQAAPADHPAIPAAVLETVWVQGGKAWIEGELRRIAESG
jgi:hypothetical protein